MKQIASKSKNGNGNRKKANVGMKKQILLYGGIALGVAALANVAIFRKAILPVVI